MQNNNIPSHLSQEIIERYNVPVPRYTSYPPANLFTTDYTHERYIEDISYSNTHGASDLSFYIHIPFCKKICSYCACNKELFPQEKDGIALYIDYVLKEFDLLIPHILKDRKISQIHFGGGSPTAIPLHYIEKILTRIISSFELKEDAEIAIECHPGYLKEEDWDYLLDLPFTRYSLGVQDFKEDVLKAVKRTPSKLPIAKIVDKIHTHHKRVNLDLIYGLPHQTPASFAESMQLAVKCNPDRLVTFSYAHVPWIYSVQKELEDLGLPEMSDKKSMHEAATQIAIQSGYEVIGLDHFVRPDDPLAIALREHTLHRNFQGYCTRAISGQVFALGTTGISQLDNSYAQNIKSIPEYYEAIDKGVLPTNIGYRLSDDERLARDIINDLMCNYRTSPLKIAKQHGKDYSKLSDISLLRYNELLRMINDGLCRIEADAVIMNSSAHLFVRTIAATFDIHYNPHKPLGYSKPI
ncbi:oxygen-independent coproporphyrinogen III oxidase [Porphyromonas sp.]|uniref:oxygen-independent coproporphyrinogen III oxidase n=1 Tax=Porphyromonas sp. TaxID=1924944 RepID=UPI0026DD6223|nr:oxygen-independent coproporphyrinogen III oxidase [Porphyromonas sp.]MDO4695405.1 oxygen-independent coproporphyrinogen III oxidase [Porphyromonas sp.]MDO4770547.1 oxygen-independent coproporphyrinogen III oxidase [Porphyromonas sp.]